MKHLLFFGACDKSDLLLYVCKLLTKLEKKILLVDATAERMYRYPVATIDQEYKITEFEGFDVAFGFPTYESLREYMQTQQENWNAYDYLIIDTDQPDHIASWPDIEHHLLVTTLEKRALLKNTELVTRLFETKDQSLVRFFKVILQAVDCNIDEEYIESTMSDFPIQWTEPSYAVYFDDVDYRTKIENQFANRLHLKPLSKLYKKVIVELVQLISGLKEQEVKVALKLAERGK